MARVNPIQFSTKYLDTEIGLVYYGYRYYSSIIARWISKDPLEEEDGPNSYEFIKNMAPNSVDTLGDQMFGFPTRPGEPAPFAPVATPPGPPIVLHPGLDPAMSDYLNGIQNSYVFGPDAPWTKAIQGYPYMDAVRSKVSKTLAADCRGESKIFGGNLPYSLDKLGLQSELAIFIRDTLQILSGQLDYTINGSFNLSWGVKTPFNCCKGKAKVHFLANDSFRFGSNTRIPGTNIGLPDNPFGPGEPFNTIPLTWYWSEDISF
jgi:RHS repeat-associated protein